ncbi:hypothetical protein TRFO_35664 [Tritrichomonas foetus]|uniref:Mitochondrial carrier protein n=1 Tax=Tritrichomonas foetus TaxID=1144522 RepID=A0A1J4JKC2_9EUKA|nr:hypothetical protein TRFO_35664 [Tritrichomonas foetus]|eukprot:OHS98021.1 hypothetical protein TRFO_35664 [Tritrichomonas foetus]
MSNSSMPPLPQTFLGAAMGRFVTDAFFKGANFKEIPIDFVDFVLSAVQGGTSYVAYRVGCDAVAAISPEFKERLNDKSKNQLPVYIAGGAAGAAFATIINYPISVVRSKRTNEKVSFSLKSFQMYYFDRVFAFMGFAASMDQIIPHLKPTNNSLHYWAQSHFLLQMSHFAGNLCEYPVYYIQNGTPFSLYMKNHLNSLTRRMFNSDFSCFFKKKLSGIPYM